MEDKIANVASYAFEIESLLDSQINSKSLPFTGMDSELIVAAIVDYPSVSLNVDM